MNAKQQEIRAELRTLLRGDMDEGYLTVDFKEVAKNLDSNPHSVLDQFVEQFEFSPLGNDWLELEQSKATDVLQFVLTHHPNFPYLKVRSPEEVYPLAEMFLSVFDEDVRFFSNATLIKTESTSSDWEKELPIQYKKIGQGKYDAGVVAIDKHQMGIFWYQDSF